MRGWSVLEMLAVLAVLLLLLALLLPACGAARRAAARGVCLAHFRQLGALATLYAEDNDGRYPDAALPLPPDFQRVGECALSGAAYGVSQAGREEIVFRDPWHTETKRDYWLVAGHGAFTIVRTPHLGR